MDSDVGMAGESRAWLRRFWGEIAVSSGIVLDLGCGRGFDSAVLNAGGREVVGLERSNDALAEARSRAPQAEFVRADLSVCLPFAAASFGVVVASLSLHYLSWEATLATIWDIRRVLGADGLLLLRVNATDDAEFGSFDGEEVEPGLRRYPLGTQSEPLKRFFSQQNVEELLVEGWRLKRLDHRVVERYGRPKRIWEAAARAT